MGIIIRCFAVLVCFTIVFGLRVGENVKKRDKLWDVEQRGSQKVTVCELNKGCDCNDHSLHHTFFKPGFLQRAIIV